MDFISGDTDFGVMFHGDIPSVRNFAADAFDGVKDAVTTIINRAANNNTFFFIIFSPFIMIIMISFAFFDTSINYRMSQKCHIKYVENSN